MGGGVPGSLWVELVGFALLGLFGSAHCLGMCGPLVTLYADSVEDDDSERGPTWTVLRQQGLFNVGRTLGYGIVGAMLGAAGSTVYGIADIAAVGNLVRGFAGMLVGIVVISAGINYLTGGPPTGTVPLPSALERAVGRVQQGLTTRVDRWAAGPGILGLGAIHAALPCPLLYPAFLWAFASGSVLEGGSALAMLGLGTFPMLFAYGSAVGALPGPTRERLHRAMGAVFILLGFVPLARGLGSVGVNVPYLLVSIP